MNQRSSPPYRSISASGLPSCLIASLVVASMTVVACSRGSKGAPNPLPTPPPQAVAAPASTLKIVSGTPPLGLPMGLQASLDKIAGETDGSVSISIRHLGLNAAARVHGEKRLPMMSVFKLPLAVAAFVDVESGKLPLSQLIALKESELRPGVSPIAEAWKRGEHTLTLESLLRQMLEESDNTAGDKLVALLGGGEAVTARLRALHISGIDIAEQELDIAARIECGGQTAPPGGWTRKAVDSCAHPNEAAELVAAKREVAEPPNGASADAMTALLAALENGTILTAESRKWILSTMLRTKTGEKRLKALLPVGTSVAHRSGTGDTFGGMNVATNDVGIITLPNGEKLAVSVLIAGSSDDLATREAAIAKVAKAAWDRFSGQ